jgi:hypothetical protein
MQDRDEKCLKNIDRSRTNVDSIKKVQHMAKYRGCEDVKEILYFVDCASRYNRVKKKQLDTQLILSKFRQPLHVSDVSRPIIRRYNRMYTYRGWRNILRISCASSWSFFTRCKWELCSCWLISAAGFCKYGNAKSGSVGGGRGGFTELEVQPSIFSLYLVTIFGFVSFYAYSHKIWTKCRLVYSIK